MILIRSWREGQCSQRMLQKNYLIELFHNPLEKNVRYVLTDQFCYHTFSEYLVKMALIDLRQINSNTLETRNSFIQIAEMLGLLPISETQKALNNLIVSYSSQNWLCPTQCELQISPLMSCSEPDLVFSCSESPFHSIVESFLWEQPPLQTKTICMSGRSDTTFREVSFQSELFCCLAIEQLYFGAGIGCFFVGNYILFWEE